MSLNTVLKVNSNSELLSFIINSTPELATVIDLPTQGEDIKPIGKMIISNERYKNAFINALNLIGLTVIDRNYWENPWETFTNRGTLNFGQSVREMIVDIAEVNDYNEFANNPTHFLENVVPQVYNYVHNVNYQKFYKTTTSDEQIAMAFNTEDGLLDLIEKIVGSLYEAYKYDKYIVDKYMLCKRIVDGTITSVEIDGMDSMTTREVVAFIKNYSSLMTFRNPNYNPAGIRIATSFADQIMILNTDFQAKLETSVLATSFFRNDAEFKTNLALIDGYGNHDEARLIELLGSAYEPFSDDDIAQLEKVPCVLIDREFFQDYNYSLDTSAEPTGTTRASNFYNPETMKNNYWLHTWKVISTSPFKQAIVFTNNVTPAVTKVEVNPSTATVNIGQSIQLKAEVTTTGFANKAVQWSVSADPTAGDAKVTVNPTTGVVTVPANYQTGVGAVKIKATSIFDATKSAEASLTIAGTATES